MDTNVQEGGKYMHNTFGKEIIPHNEKQRLKALQRIRLLRSIPEGYFNTLAQIMAQSFDVPIALVSLVDSEMVDFQGNYGMQETNETSRGVSLCSLAILDDQPTIFNNALEEPCLIANPLVAGEFGLRFYAGAPIVTSNGYAIGTVCLVDKEPRPFSEKEKEMLSQFAQNVIDDLEVRQETLSQ